MKSAVLPKHFPSGESKSFKVGRMTMTFKTTACEDWNSYTVCEAIEPPESGAGYHRHPTYDETFIICEGRYDFRLDDKLLKLGPGDVVFVPRGTQGRALFASLDTSARIAGLHDRRLGPGSP